MITVTYRLSPNGVMSLDMKGHADSVRGGVDPVCAAASILIYNLAEEVRTMEGEGLLRRPPHLLLEKGDAHLSLLPKGRGERRAEQVFNTLMTGFFLLERDYPQCVRVIPSES